MNWCFVVDVERICVDRLAVITIVNEQNRFHRIRRNGMPIDIIITSDRSERTCVSPFDRNQII